MQDVKLQCIFENYILYFFRVQLGNSFDICHYRYPAILCEHDERTLLICSQSLCEHVIQLLQQCTWQRIFSYISDTLAADHTLDSR